MNAKTIIRPFLTSILLLSAAGYAAGCTAPGLSEDLVDEPLGTNAPMSFEQYLDQAVTHYDPETDEYIVEGDILLVGVDKVREHYQRTFPAPGALTVNLYTDGLWDSTERKSLTYCINEAAFGSHFSAVKADMALAAARWEAIADVDFIYMSQENGNCTNNNNNVLFNVDLHAPKCQGNLCTVASAFFPYDGRSDRVLNIYSDYLDYSDLEGTLEHELGHVLGFMHEHIWTSCTAERTYAAYQLTDYDTSSIMHYQWCDGAAGGDLRLSLLDAQGAQTVYGASRFRVKRLNDFNTVPGDTTNIVVGDFNGDDMDDFIRQEQGAWDNDSVDTAQVWLSNGNGQFTIVTPTDHNHLKGDSTILHVGDFNNDGMDDFIRQEKGAWDNDSDKTAEVWFSDGDGNFTVVTPNWADDLKGDLTNLYLGDFNGDGKTDFIRQEKGWWDDNEDNTANVWFSNGNGTFTVVTPANADTLKGDFTNLYVGDFNGDGMDDFIRQEKGAWDDDSTNTAQVWLSNGDGSFNVVTPPVPDALKGDFTNLYVGDFNGDGKDDFIRQEKSTWDDNNVATADVWLSTGNGTFTITWSSINTDLKGDLTTLSVADFNNDGKADFVRRERGSWADDDTNMATVWISTGNGTFTRISLPAEWTLHGDYTNLLTGDFDGDGRADFIRQEKGSWADDDADTAQVFLSRL